MARQCYFCGKRANIGMNVSHSNIKLKRKWLPNLQSVKIKVKGKTTSVKACTKCLKKGKTRLPAGR